MKKTRKPSNNVQAARDVKARARREAIANGTWRPRSARFIDRTKYNRKRGKFAAP